MTRRMVEARALAVSRICIGSAVIIKASDLADVLDRAAQASLLRVSLLPGVPWPSIVEGRVLAVAVAVAGALIVAGFHARLAAGSTALMCGLMILADQQLWGNHFYLMALMTGLLATTRCDQVLAVRRVAPGPLGGGVYLMMVQASIVYGYAGLLKLNGDFLSGEVLAQFLGGGLIGFPDGWKTGAILGPLAVAAVLTELFLAAGLWLPATRKLAVWAGLALHCSIALLMDPFLELAPFGLLMFSTYPLFLAVGGSAKRRVDDGVPERAVENQ